MSSRRLFPFVWLLWIVFAGVSIFLLTRPSVTDVSAQAAFLRLPVYGNPVITTLFDHEYPNYDSDGIFTRNDGQRWVPPAPVDRVNCDTGENCYDGHDGIDYDSPYSRILAAADGNVSDAGWDIPGCHRTEDAACRFGLRVLIGHANGYYTFYGHLSATAVRVADVVQTGDLIATSGETGRTGGPHLHFTVRLADGTVVNPYGWRGGMPDPWEQQSGVASLCLWLDAGEECVPPVNMPPTEYETILVTVNNAGFSKGCLGGGEACWLPLGSDLWGSSQPAGDWARWQPTLATGATYEVRVRVPDFGNSRVYEADYTVQHANGVIDGLRISQNDTNDADRWYYLGRYTFNSGSMGYLELEEITLGGYNAGRRTLADSVQFVRVSPPLPTPTATYTPVPTDQCPQSNLSSCTPTPTPSITPSPTKTPTPTTTPTPTEPADIDISLDQNTDDAGPNAVSTPCSASDEQYSTIWPEIYLGRCPDGAMIVSGVRFQSVPLPPDSQITKALIQFVVDNDDAAPDTDVLDVEILGELSANSLTFSMIDRPSNRFPLTSSVPWYVGSDDPWEVEEIHYTPDISNIVQQLVDLNDWQMGDPMTFIIRSVGSGNETRRVFAIDREGVQFSAHLQIWYEGPTPTPSPTPYSFTFNPTANSPGSGGDNNGYEVNPGNAYTDNGVYAVDNNSGTGSGIGVACASINADKHLFYNYDIPFDNNEDIVGISVHLQAKVNSLSGSPKLCVQLSWDGGVTWTTGKTTSVLKVNENTYVLGGATDTWGHAWSGLELGNSSFRVRVVDVSAVTTTHFSLDWAGVTIYYYP